MKANLIIILWVIFCLTNSAHAMNTEAACFSCNKSEVLLLRCSACKLARYCNGNCQKNDWPHHSQWCSYYKKFIESNNIDQSVLHNTYSRDDVWRESFRIFALVHQSTPKLKLDSLGEDTFFDQQAIIGPVAPALFLKSLNSLKSPAGKNELDDVKQILMPAIGFLSPLEFKALNMVFEHPIIYGFDSDQMSIILTKSANPSLSKTITTANGLLDKTWSCYVDKNIDMVLFMHPLFAIKTWGGASLHKDAEVMLGHTAKKFPNTKVIIINKSVSEADAIKEGLIQLNYRDIQIIDNGERSFPGMSCSDKLLNVINIFCMNPVPRTSNMAQDLWNIMEKNPSDKAKHLEKDGEHRYHFIIVATTPKP